MARLIAIVGPSGVGKDSVLTGLAGALPQAALVKREITRAPELGGEDYTPLTEAAFQARRAAGAYCLSWGAHGLFYGIPAAVEAATATQDHLANLSRGVLLEAHRKFPGLVVLNLTATPQTLAQRVADRGRESAPEIAARLSRKVAAFDPSLPVHHISNDGTLAQTVQAALAVLTQPQTQTLTQTQTKPQTLEREA